MKRAGNVTENMAAAEYWDASERQGPSPLNFGVPTPTAPYRVLYMYIIEFE